MAMSATCETFIRNVLAKKWGEAFKYLNGLNMPEMLRGIAALDPLDRAELWAQRAASAGAVHMPRIEYAWAVVQDGALPSSAPGDLDATGQVQDAKSYIAKRTPLVFGSDLTGTLPMPGGAPRLSDTDFVTAASGLGADVSSVMAVAQVEAGGRAGFAADGRPIIRYELHIFHQRTHGIYAKSHPHLSQPSLKTGNPFHVGGQPNEWSLMYGAMILRDAKGNQRTTEAWSSASWGMFQVMGFNHISVGWPDIHGFARDMCASEANQLRAFLGFVRSSKLTSAIVAHDWARFAQGYNGAGYAVNQYDTKIAAAYTRISADRKAKRLPH